MPDVGFVNLFVVALVAFAVPLGLGLAPRLRLPAPVVEILAGIVLGPGVLGWVHADLPVQVLSVVGLAFLLFLAGLGPQPRARRDHAVGDLARARRAGARGRRAGRRTRRAERRGRRVGGGLR